MAERGLRIKQGDVYGYWTALEDDECINERRYVFCRCKCGTEKKVRVDGLLKGVSKSCGCLKSPNIKDCIGHKYGNLTIIGEGNNPRVKSVKCLCDCGNVVEKHFDKVLNGKRTTCGRCNYQQVKIGDAFGRWTVIGKSRKSKSSYHKEWLCKCSCEKQTIMYVDEQNLKRGLSLSCGCITIEECCKKNFVHGDTNTRLYIIWCSMRERCTNEKQKSYPSYGGRGITVCEEWNDYLNFKKWAMENGYKDNLTIDRIDVNGNYCPENCRWATTIEQANNKRNNLRITYRGVTHTGAEWGRITGINGKEIRKLYHSGLNMEEILKRKGVVL